MLLDYTQMLTFVHASGMTYRAISRELDVSLATVLRTARGDVQPRWPLTDRILKLYSERKRLFNENGLSELVPQEAENA